MFTQTFSHTTYRILNKRRPMKENRDPTVPTHRPCHWVKALTQTQPTFLGTFFPPYLNRKVLLLPTLKSPQPETKINICTRHFSF